METRSFYDERSPDELAGVFDLRRWPEGFRRSLVAATNARLASMGAASAHISLDAYGFAILPEPPLGPDARWTRLAAETHQFMEVSVGGMVPPLVRVSRVYRLDFDSFDEESWSVLLMLFSQLPEWLGLEPYPHWFGEREGPPPFLWGEFVPDGFRVQGCVQRSRWVGWDTWLRANMHELPLLRA